MGQQFTYDGFENLTDTSVTKGSAPSFSTTYSASTNRRAKPGSGDTVDSNGNITLVNSQCLGHFPETDIENRISGVVTDSGDTSLALLGAAQYGYDAGNKRVWRGSGTLSGSLDELTFWAPNGQKLGT
jgi:hypothetical protein